MAEEGDVLTNLDSDNGTNGGNGADTLPVAGVLSQYIKDLSVENPKAPESFQWTEQPQIESWAEFSTTLPQARPRNASGQASGVTCNAVSGSA